MPVVWHVPPTQAIPAAAEDYATRLHQGVVAIARRWAPAIAMWMKSNAPWQDQTGAARRGLFTDVIDVANEMVIILLSHGPNVPYGVFLELSNAGRFQIIAPAIDHFMPRVWADVQQLVRTL